MIASIPTPMFASALQFAFDKATTEGRITIAALAVVSLFSWMVIITKIFQLSRAARMTKDFLAAYKQTRDPLELHRKGEQFVGAPVYELYCAGAEELDEQRSRGAGGDGQGKIDGMAFDCIRVEIEEAAMGEALELEKGMTVLSTAVSGGPFIGLLGTVWGVMETFSGIAQANTATLTAMAPGVAGALIATVIGLLVAIPAMFAYNFMVARIRAFTQELDGFAIRFATQIEQHYVNRGGEGAFRVVEGTEQKAN